MLEVVVSHSDQPSCQVSWQRHGLAFGCVAVLSSEL